MPSAPTKYLFFHFASSHGVLSYTGGGSDGDLFDEFITLGSDNSVDATWRRHMVFGGTNILQHVERNEGEGLHEG